MRVPVCGYVVMWLVIVMSQYKETQFRQTCRSEGCRSQTRCGGREPEWGLREECVVLDRDHEAVDEVNDSRAGEKARRGGGPTKMSNNGTEQSGGTMR